MADKKILFKILIAVFLLGTTFSAKALAAGGGGEGAKFDPGTFILDHIGDAYDWHILTYKGHHVSIPLPVILYSKHHGFHVFMSSKFHHGQSGYKWFKIAGEGEEHKGKIVEQTLDGSFVRPALDISITKNVFALFVSIAIILWVFISVANTYVKRGNQAPKGLQSWVEPIIFFVRDDIARPAIGHDYHRFMPYLLTLFFFILINNLMGLIPIFPFGANVTGNIAITMVLALITFTIATCNTNKHYWIHIFNAPGVPLWLKIPVPLMPIVEVMGVFIKPLVLMIRLFANVTAGHIIILSFFSLIFLFGNMSPLLGYGVSIVSVAFTIFMTMLELLVAFIQAYVFTLLSALYFGMAAPKH
jgi:F-type H+-transporting ATPase subunit a